jgi:hypothetical protein
MLYNTALIPEQQFQQAPSRGGRGGSGEFKSQIPGEDYFGIGDAPEGLQYTDKLMKSSVDLFKKRQDLINYAKNMWTRYGIDVTNPDPSRQDSIVAAEAFKQEIGNYLSSVDMAKEGQKIYNQMIPRYMDNTFAPGQDVNSQYASTLSPEQLGYSKNVDPLLKFSEGGINRTFETGRDYRNAQGDAARLQQAYGDPNQGGAAGIQAMAAQSLNPLMNVPAPVKPPADGNANQVAGLITEWGQLSAGAHPSFKVTDRVGPGGSYLSESTSNAFIGKSFGKYQDPSTQVNRDFIISRIVKDNDTGEVYGVNDAGFRKVLPKENIDVSIREVIPGSSLNEYEKYIGNAQQQGLLPKQTGQGGLSTFTLPAEMFVPTKDIQASAATQQQAQSIKPVAQAEQQKILSDVEILDSSFLNRWNPFSGTPDLLEYDSDLGKIEVKGQDGIYTVKVNGVTQKDKKATKKYSKNDLANFLTEANVVGAKIRDSKGKELSDTFKYNGQSFTKAQLNEMGYDDNEIQQFINEGKLTR